MGTLYEVRSDGTVDFQQNATSEFVIEQGSSNPVSGVEGQLFWRTDTKQPVVHDGTDFKAILGGSFRVYNEKVNETPNGSITAFTVDNPYVSSTTEVYIDGVQQERGVDYTESTPSTGEITFTSAPASSTVITVSYSRVEGSSLPLLNKFDVVVGTPKDTYSGSTTVFDLPFAYTVGTGSLLVYSAGVLMLEGASEDYVETDNNTITFNTARTSGEIVQFVKLGAANDQETSGWVDAGTSVRLQTNTDQVQIGDGTAGTPALSFLNDPDTGLYSVAADQLGIAIGGNARHRFDEFQLLTSSNSSNSTPSLANLDDPDTGLLWLTGSINFVVDGAQAANFSGSQAQFLDGTSAAPGISFLFDLDTGIFRNGANDMRFVTGGNIALSIIDGAQVTITAPGTGDTVELSGTNDRFIPGVDNTLKLGDSSFRWTEVFAANGTINTSHSSTKSNIRDLEDLEIPRAVRFERDGRYYIGYLNDNLPDEARPQGDKIGNYENAVVGILCHWVEKLRNEVSDLKAQLNK